MLSPQLRRKVHDLWSLFWSSGLSNPLVAIEQITYLLFIRQLEKLDGERVKQGKRSIYSASEEEEEKRNQSIANIRDFEKRATNRKFTNKEISKDVEPLPEFSKCRWSYIRQNPSFALLNETVFPWLRTLEQRVGPAQNGNTTLGRISGRLSDAYFILDPNKTETLKRAVSLIDELFRQLDTRSVNSDIMGDIFEYLLEEVKESGKNGQFRTPRHVIRFMVELMDPPLDAKVLDPACGSGGFLLNTLLHWKAKHTDEDVLRLEWDGTPHDVRPVWPAGQQPNFNLQFHGYDNDRTMVRIAWMNLILHDLESPEVHQLDALSKRLSDDQSSTYDIILANPPFTGSVDEGDLSENRTRFPAAEGKGKGAITTKSELLFVWLMLDLLKIGGRAAVIVPDGVLFGSTNAHRALRRQLLFENTLEAVISLPANMFQPYSGVKTSIIVFQKASDKRPAGEPPRTREVWFYEVTDEAYTLDQRRKARPGQDNDLWDALEKFKAWTRYREGETADKKGKARNAAKDASRTAEVYHQPEYWEERWRSVDDEFLKVFPDKANDKGHTYPLHELWPGYFKFDQANLKGAKQYDEKVLDYVGQMFAQVFKRVCGNAFGSAFHQAANPGDPRTNAEKAVKALASYISKQVRDNSWFDREFDQFGLSALKSLLKEMSDQVGNWLSGKKEISPEIAPVIPAPRIEKDFEILAPWILQLAQLDGYNVWRRSNEVTPLPGKLTASDDGSEAKRVPTQLSWIVPVRQWAERETWGEDPKTKKPIEKPTHKNGVLDPKYLDWLRDTLKVFGSTDGTVDRLDPDCLEALDFNLSAGRHQPFTFDAGQHRPPAELIKELQALHAEVQQRLAKLLTMVEGASSGSGDAKAVTSVSVIKGEPVDSALKRLKKKLESEGKLEEVRSLRVRETQEKRIKPRDRVSGKLGKIRFRFTPENKQQPIE
jgi:type I restriction enzyme M protein